MSVRKDRKEGTVGLTVGWINGALRVMTQDGEPIAGVLAFDLAAAPEDMTYLNVEVIMHVPKQDAENGN